MKSVFDRGMQIVLFAVIAIAFCFGAGPTEAQGPPMYDVVEIGPGTDPADLNNLGEVVGGVRASFPGKIGFRAFYWLDGVLVDLGGEWVDNASPAVSINDSGVILGTVEGSSDELDRLFEIDSAGNISYPEPFEPTVDVRAKDINDAGHIAGTYQSLPNSTGIPFFWDGTTPFDLVPGWAQSSIFPYLNNRGQVVGTSYVNGCGNSGFLWEKDFFTEIGTCIEQVSVWDINDASQIVGSKLFVGEFQTHAFLYYDGEGPPFTDLGVLDEHETSIARSINNHGWIVGDSYREQPPSRRAFVYVDGAMHDLTSFVPDTWHIAKALKINDQGQILA